MNNKFIDIERRIVRSWNVYSIKDRLLRRDRNEVKVRKIETSDGKYYKHIKITKKGIGSRYQMYIERARECLSSYTDSDCVPKLIYADSEQLLVNWIDGTPMHLLNMEKQDYLDLGRFTASSLREFKLKSVQQIIMHLDSQLFILGRENVLDKTLIKNITSILNEKAIQHDTVEECICFGDTAHMNFLRDKDGFYHYIDIFGIYRAPIGRIFAKQITAIPLSFRKAFAHAYRQSLPYSGIRLDIPFYYLIYLIDRIYDKCNKTKLFSNRSGKKKLKVAKNNLEGYIKAAPKEKDLTEWIMNI